ncbi:MAG TPA: glycine betaine ABC transporter substrate-binding protein [Nocardioidaceae bacterium]|nr:glycine betaine ABC transporter substrate-binding protein [Nocardioidaceae bacterium]
MTTAMSGCGLGEKDETTDVEAGSVDPTALEGVTVKVGSKDFDEQLIIGQLTLQMLSAAGADVVDETNIQGTNASRQALVTGAIDVYWDYTGTGWINHLGHDNPIPDTQKLYEAVRDEDLEENGLVWGKYAPMNNTYALAVTKEFSEENDVTTSSDMAEFVQQNPDEATVCLESEFAGRPDGWDGFQQAYGMEIPDSNLTEVGTGVVYTELDKGDTCNFGEVFTTDGRIAALDLVPLEDDKSFFPIYAVCPIVTEETDAENPEILEVLAPLAETLTTETMTELNAQVSAEGLKPEDVAHDYLQEQGFIE